MQNNYDNRMFVRNDVVYAGFWVRLAAYVLDSVIVFLMMLLVRLALSGIMSAVRGTALGGNILFHYTLKDIVLYLGQALYFILCTRFTGTTIGKKAMNLRVVNADGSAELDFLTVVYRETVGRFLCRLPMCIGYLMTGLDKEKRGIHDMLCDTRVVYAKKIKADFNYGQIPVPPIPVPQPGGVPQMMGAGRPGQQNPVPMPPMRPGTPGQPGSAPIPPVRTGAPGQTNSAPIPPVRTGAPDRTNSAPMPPVGPGMPGQPGSGAMPPANAMHQHGPYRMVPPKEQNLYATGEPSDDSKQSHQEAEEKEDFNKS